MSKEMQRIKNWKQFLNENTQYNSFSKLTEKRFI